jgi:hypothetical protein
MSFRRPRRSSSGVSPGKLEKVSEVILNKLAHSIRACIINKPELVPVKLSF